MSSHALLSPSSAYRWLNCPLAPRLEASLPNKTSEYAKEGTLAHSLCDISARLYFKKIKKSEYNKTFKKLQADSLWNDEMLRTAKVYVEHLASQAMSFKQEPHIALEKKVELSHYVPSAFGQCDCIMGGENTLIITDYKHGKGVPVTAQYNSQLMLYAIGALNLYKPLFGDTIHRIILCIDQPRLNIYDTWEIATKELLQWGEAIKPKAQAAFIGIGKYNAGDWCRFCRANGICKAQAEQTIGTFGNFSNKFGQPMHVLSNQEIGDILQKGEQLTNWYKAVQEQACERLLSGNQIPGYKLVEGRSSRTWSDQDKALLAIEKSGIEKSMIYNHIPKSLAELEKMMGKVEFARIAGDYVCKPIGKPTLALESDTRRAYSSAVSDFANITTEKQENENV